MKYLEKINSLQIEISSNCNLHCPGCARIDQTTNGIHKLIKKNVFLNLDIIKELLKSKSTKKKKKISFHHISHGLSCYGLHTVVSAPPFGLRNIKQVELSNITAPFGRVMLLA